MVLESTVVCVDSGEFMRNGDFTPTRMHAQQEAVNLLIQCKLRSNPENVVGMLSMAPGAKVEVGLTQDASKLLCKLHQIQPKGDCAFSVGIKVAQLVLKHRQNRNHKTRIVVFVGSPVEESQDELIKLAKKLKKDKFQVDMVSFGEANANNDKLDVFVKTINGNDKGSHLVSVPAGANLQEVLLQSPVLRSEDGEAPPVTIGAGGAFDFGIDPNEDPELAMALRVSLEEQRLRQEQQAAVTAQQSAQQVEAVAQPTTPGVTAAAAVARSDEAATTPAVEGTGGVFSNEMAFMTEEEQMEMALRMSMMPPEPVATSTEPALVEPMDAVSCTQEAGQTSSHSSGNGPKKSQMDSGLEDVMSDPQTLEALLGTLPGVNVQSDTIRQVVDEAKKEKEAKENDKKPPKP